MTKGYLLKNTRLFVNQYEMSGLSRSFDSLLKDYERIDMTPWDYNVSRAMGNRLEVGIEGYSALLDTSTGKSADALTENQNAHVSLLIAAAATLVVGDLAYLCPGVQLGGQLELMDGAVGFSNVNFYPEPNRTGAYFINPFAKVLEFNTRRTTTLTGDSVDNGAASTAGWSAILHITVGGANWSIKIQHSANNEDWADLTEFTAVGSAATAEHKSGADTVNQYTRILATKTSGDLLCVLCIARN